MDVTAIAQQNSDLSRARALAGRSASPKNGDLLNACQEFESLFVKQMLKAMNQTLAKDGMLDGGFAERVYEDMLLDEYSLKIAQTARLGIADMLYRQLSERNV